MENKVIARTFKLLAALMELHDGNPFKIKSYQGAAFRLDKLPVKLHGISVEELEKIEGVGKSIAAKVFELCSTGKIAELESLLSETPPGVVSMLSIKGIGPKKIAIIWKELGIEDIIELYYACNENRLVEAKGFGYKTQEEIKKSIEFLNASMGKFHYAVIEELALDLEKQLKSLKSASLVSLTGTVRRKCEVIEQLDFLIATVDSSALIAELNSLEFFNDVNSSSAAEWKGKLANGLEVQIQFCPSNEFYWKLFVSTGSTEHVKQMDLQAFPAGTEQEIYAKAGLPFIAPEMREDIFSLEQLKSFKTESLLQLADLKGILHNHSTYSDGIHSLEEMANYCKELGYEYLGISDHSKTAVYAKGLPIERVFEQHAEIEKLNAKLAPFKIFKGIESDILSDGSLDYPEEMLKTFDFIVASIHSNLKMDIEKATNRLLKAIENPYTTILGHPTGRLLLGRTGYPIDHKKVIDACAANKVIIELNANPHRLDIDWRWIPYALEKGVMISINPDAHRKEGFHDMHFGVLSGRKGGLIKDMTFNVLSRNQMEDYFQAKSPK